MNPNPIYDQAAWDHGFAPIHRELGAVKVLRHEPICSRCTDNGAIGDYCTACVAEIAHSVTAVRYAGHGINHHYRADVAL